MGSTVLMLSVAGAKGLRQPAALCPMCFPLCWLASMAEFTVALSLTVMRGVSNSHRFH